MNLNAVFLFGSNLAIYAFGVFLALGFVVVSFAIWKQARDRGLLEEKYLDTLILTAITSLIGSRLGYVISNWSSIFSIDPARIILFSKYPGMSIEIGVVAGVIGTVVFAFLSRLSILETLDIFAFALAIGTIFGYGGCAISRCADEGGQPEVLFSLASSVIVVLLLSILIRTMTRSVRLAKYGRRFGMVFLSYLILWSFSLLMLSVYRNTLAESYLFPAVVLGVCLLVFTIRYPDFMTQFPQSLLNQMKSYLENRSGHIEKRLKRLQSEDPFRDKDRTLEDTSDDDNAQSTNAHEQSTALQRQLNMALVQTRKALTKIKIGKYGICENCGKSIETGRLVAMPTATLCLSCEKKKES